MVLRPASPFQAAGMRTEPPVSVPAPAAARPSATATAVPELDPPGARPGSIALGGVAVTGLTPRPEKASSLRWVLPRGTTPAAAAFAKTAASRSGTRPARSFEPASVTSPAMSMLSFQQMGTPSSGPWRIPLRARSAASAAAARARAGRVRV